MTVEPRELDALFETTSLGAPEKAVGFVLWRVLHRYLREMDRTLAPLDLTHLQFMTLAMAAWLARSGEPVTQAALARHGDIHRMQVSQMLKALEGKGLVARARGVTDVRTKHVEVTDAGVAVLRDAMPLAITVQRDLFGDSGSPGGDLLKTLLRLEN